MDKFLYMWVIPCSMVKTEIEYNIGIILCYMDTNREIIKKSLIQALEQLPKSSFLPPIEINIVEPPDPTWGDYASPLPLQLAKYLKQKPVELANRIVTALLPVTTTQFDKPLITQTGYINFSLSTSWLQNSLHTILELKNNWGRITTPQQKVLVEYSSPNIAKRMHVGHFRSTLIGNALDKLFRHLGYSVVNDNHLGDWGTQFGKLLVAYHRWHPHAKASAITVPQLEELYIRYHKEAENDPLLEKEARAYTVKLQQGDAPTRRIWEEFCRISLIEFDYIYQLFGIKFEYHHGESFYEPMLPGIVNESLEKKIAIESQGAVIIPLDEVGLPPFMIRKSDGGYLYSTTDLATIKWREEHLNPDLVLYVVGDQQTLHFKQLFASANKLGYTKNTKLVHVPFGLILGEHGRKMSTREGEAVDAMYFINKSVELAKQIIDEKNPSPSSPLTAQHTAKIIPNESERSDIAKRIALSALVYNDLSRDRDSSVTFNWDTMMNFKGSSAPYLLYTYVRINGIMKKIHMEHPDDLTVTIDATVLNEPYELLLLRRLVKFPEALEDAAAAYKPHYLVQYLENLANTFHTAYDRLPVASAEENIRRARLSLFQAVANTMKIGMEIMGMQPVERM